MCSRPITRGLLLCDRCDRSRPASRSSNASRKEGFVHTSGGEAAADVAVAPITLLAAPPLGPNVVSPAVGIAHSADQEPGARDHVLLLDAAGVAAVIVGRNGNIEAITEEASRLHGSESGNESHLESFVASIDTSNFAPARRPLGKGEVMAICVPLRDGATAIILKAAPERDPVATFDEYTEPFDVTPELLTVGEVVRTVADRFGPYAKLKSVHLQVDMPPTDSMFGDPRGLDDALSALMDNALHYVSSGGHVAIGLRRIEHKGKQVTLFFVMDNGPQVPDDQRARIFDADFIWNPKSPERGGRSLSRCRDFASRHGGSIWVDARTGRACTFFLRLPAG